MIRIDTNTRDIPCACVIELWIWCRASHESMAGCGEGSEWLAREVEFSTAHHEPYTETMGFHPCHLGALHGHTHVFLKIDHLAITSFASPF